MRDAWEYWDEDKAAYEELMAEQEQENDDEIKYEPDWVTIMKEYKLFYITIILATCIIILWGLLSL